jgi:hypothetical protein
VVIETPKSRNTERKSTVEFTSKRKQFGSSENIYSYAKLGEREREREMKKGCEVKHLPWQMLHNTMANAVFE